MFEKHPLVKYIVWLLLAAWVYTLTFIFDHYWSKYASYKSVTQSFQKQLISKEKAFDDWAKDENNIALALNKPSNTALADLQQQPFYVFIYDTKQPEQALFWSTNDVLPETSDLRYKASGSYKKYGNGKYELLKREVNVGGKQLLVVGLILLHQEFYIENNNLPNEYPGFHGLDDKLDLITEKTDLPLKGETGSVLLYFKPLVKEPIFIFNWASFIVQCIASFFLLVYITKVTTALFKQRRLLLSLSLFAALFFLLRYLIIYHNIPIDVKRLPMLEQAPLTEPKLDKFGVLMVNAFFALWLASFLTRHTTSILQYIKGQTDKKQWGIIACCAVAVVLGHLYMVYIVSDLYLKSSVAFDLPNFLSLNYTTILSFFILFLLCASHYMFLRFFALVLLRMLRTKRWLLFVIMSVAGLLTITLLVKHSFAVPPMLFSLLWVLLFFAFGSSKNLKPAPATVGVTVIWLLIYSFSLSLLLSHLGDYRIRARTEAVSESMVLKKNVTGEKEVKLRTSLLRKVNWSNILYTCISNEELCQHLKDSLVKQYLGGTFERSYTSSIYIFDHAGNSANFDEDVSYESLNTLYTTGEPTVYPPLMLLNESYDKFGYIVKDSIKSRSSGEVIGSVFIVVRSSGSSNKPFAPELFKQLQEFAVDLPQGYSYAWYKNGMLIEQYRNYPFPTQLPEALQNNQSTWENKTPEAFERWVKTGQFVLSLAAQRKVSVNFISTLAYLFGAFLLFYFFMAGINLLFKGSFFSARTFNSLTLNLQNKIRITVISILLISFVIVAVVTISFFINQFKTANEERLAKAAQAISADMVDQLPRNFEVQSRREQKNYLEKLLSKISSAQNLDANLFDNNGKMLSSSSIELFDKAVVSPMINPKAWQQLKSGQAHRYIINEKIGKLNFISIYQPIRLRGSRVFGYLQVPYYVSQNELNQEISNFLVILINIIAFVFLLSGGLAYWISGSITKSFNIIAGKMDRIRLSERNERIVWNRNDEIGHLVSRYNKMVDQLEDSARMMARTERELAWREMARQVAHEIKNPLTPMKLSLQFLQKAIREKSADVNQITERVAGNLVGQIDHLSNIATEFSQFANLGNYNPEVFDVQAVLKDIVQLYDMQENVTVTWQQLPFSLMIKADKTQVNRLFTNLFQNAVEAASDKEAIEITIIEELRPNSIVISISDNGSGIPEQVQPNIFRPNFTTKSAGTGLGLAICKAIVENAGGQIWFKTGPDTGTSFYVQVPLTEAKV